MMDDMTESQATEYLQYVDKRNCGETVDQHEQRRGLWIKSKFPKEWNKFTTEIMREALDKSLEKAVQHNDPGIIDAMRIEIRKELIDPFEEVRREEECIRDE